MVEIPAAAPIKIKEKNKYNIFKKRTLSTL